VQCWKLTTSLKQSRKQSPNSKRASGFLEQPATKTDRQSCERILKLSDWKLVLELGAGSGHFEHSQWKWNSGIWSLVNCIRPTSTMLLNVCHSLNIFNAEKSVNDHVKKSITSSVFSIKSYFAWQLAVKLFKNEFDWNVKQLLRKL